MESDSKQPTYVLVDGSSYLFRAYYALPDLRNSKGEATGAIRGVISMIKKLEKDFPESLVVVVFDAPAERLETIFMKTIKPTALLRLMTSKSKFSQSKIWLLLWVFPLFVWRE